MVNCLFANRMAILSLVRSHARPHFDVFHKLVYIINLTEETISQA